MPSSITGARSIFVDIIEFYNIYFLPEMKGFLGALNRSFEKNDNRQPSPELAPVPTIRDVYSPRKLSSKHHIYFSPMKALKILPLSPHKEHSKFGSASPIMSPFTRQLYSDGEPSLRQGPDNESIDQASFSLEFSKSARSNRRSNKRLEFSQLSGNETAERPHI
jgi:hypothetical protein